MNTEKIYGCRMLISSIILQAYDDILSLNISPSDRRSAVSFLNSRNDLFCIYCYLLSLDPVYTEEKIKYRLYIGEMRIFFNMYSKLVKFILGDYLKITKKDLKNIKKRMPLEFT